MGKNKLIRSLFIFNCHEKSIFIAIWENISFIFSNFGNFWEFESLFPKKRNTKMQIVDLGALPVSLRIVFIPLGTQKKAKKTVFAHLSRMKLLYLQNSGSSRLMKWKYCHFWKVVPDWSANQRPSICFVKARLMFNYP